MKIRKIIAITAISLLSFTACEEEVTPLELDGLSSEQIKKIHQEDVAAKATADAKNKAAQEEANKETITNTCVTCSPDDPFNLIPNSVEIPDIKYCRGSKGGVFIEGQYLGDGAKYDDFIKNIDCK